jgi:formamidopyrimidine-DNA glycosylase
LKQEMRSAERLCRVLPEAVHLAKTRHTQVAQGREPRQASKGTQAATCKQQLSSQAADQTGTLPYVAHTKKNDHNVEAEGIFVLAMPELPDVTLYVERLQERFVNDTLTGVRLASAFVLRTADPPLAALSGRKLSGVSRLGKRIVFDFGEQLYAVIHLMIAGRFRVHDAPNAKIPGRLGLLAFDFARAGTLILTEASTKKRASLHLARGSLAAFDRGGIEPLEADLAAFAQGLARERHTLKRTLTDPKLFSGIGNAYSDEILHAAKLSLFRMSDALTEAETERLHTATRTVLQHWLRVFRASPGFPEKVTAFREGMAVHGRYGKPCPDCGTSVQRIRYASNECNYCPKCQTEGRLLMDRSLSKLLKGDWPKTLEELEERKATLRTQGPARG